MNNIGIEECWLSLIFLAPMIFFFGCAIGMVRENIVDVLFESLALASVLIVGSAIITVDDHGLDLNYLVLWLAFSIVALVSMLTGGLTAFRKKGEGYEIQKNNS